VAAEKALQECFELFEEGEGSDAIMTLEIFLEEQQPTGLILLTLGQLYLMGGQGEPELLPREGPAADVGRWERNQGRLLSRAETLLRQTAGFRPDDSVVDFLLADVARARGDTAAARRAFATGQRKCTLKSSFELMKNYQKLIPRPARILATESPEYPTEAVERKAAGEVQLDLLVNPQGQVVQVEVVVDPDASLTAAAARALRKATIQPARLGKYPLWSWLRVPTRFTLSE
jgi:TonB family protein